MPHFTLNSRRFAARAREDRRGFYLLAGSHVSATIRATLHAAYRRQREELIAAGDLRQAESGEHLVLTRDVRCQSPSAAASIVRGYPSNGHSSWRSSSGCTPTRSTRFGVKSFASRRGSLARNLLALAESFDGLTGPDAQAWRAHFQDLAERLRRGDAPPECP